MLVLAWVLHGGEGKERTSTRFPFAPASLHALIIPLNANTNALVGQHPRHDGADRAPQPVGGEDVQLVVHVRGGLHQLTAHVAEDGGHLCVCLGGGVCCVCVCT